MNKNARPLNRKVQPSGKDTGRPSSKLRFVYILTLLLMIFSLFARVSGVRRGSTARQDNQAAAARLLVFHHEDTNLCEDLMIDAAWNAVLSNCENGVEKQYPLNSSERSQIQSWIATYSPVNYDHVEQAPTGNSSTRLYLNGQGKQHSTDADTQQMVNFATALSATISSAP